MTDDGLDWEQLTTGQREAVRLISERSFLRFEQIWFQLTQGQRFMTNWHHEYMCHVGEQMVRRERGNTIINIPPGGTKTETWSIFFPAWSHIQSIAPSPRQRYLSLSYADTLVKRNSRRVRDMIKSKEWQELWPRAFLSDQAEEWQLTDERERVVFEMVSKSAGGQVTGGRGGYPGPEYSGALMLDDFSKPEDMFSEAKRDRYNRMLVDTVRSRRGDKSEAHPTPILSIQQRLHQLDATGFMMDGGMGLDFDLIKIPALIDEGYIESLPEPFRSKCWASVKGTPKAGEYWSYWPQNEAVGQLMDLWDKNEYTFMSQYMQEPIALGGQLFDPEWWQYYETRPFKFEYRFITADTAQKKGQHNDYSVFCHWGVYDGCLYLLDMYRGKMHAPELRAAFKSFAWACHKDNHDQSVLRHIDVEDKSSGTGLIQDLSGELPVAITPIQRSKDKVTRAYDTTPQIKAGRVYLPSGAHWLTEFVSEHSAFTVDDTHKHDDMVDNTMDAVDLALLATGVQVAVF